MNSHDMGTTAASFPDRIWPEIDVAARIRRAATQGCRVASEVPHRIRGRCHRTHRSP
jgi:hypothetical protein